MGTNSRRLDKCPRNLCQVFAGWAVLASKEAARRVALRILLSLETRAYSGDPGSNPGRPESEWGRVEIFPRSRGIPVCPPRIASSLGGARPAISTDSSSTSRLGTGACRPLEFEEGLYDPYDPRKDSGSRRQTEGEHQELESSAVVGEPEVSGVLWRHGHVKVGVS